ncbi:type IV pilin protein [Noviherbaspirillum galbum]|uniref:Prepilin-type N-terminal cleavage/methylation domain-containing protein n=1 Tax=Noviherbaspirillum galbum TaxID=2709383 RepID=A0A6B3SRG6_9BURK|nr:type IV pilin protein [Noviherbaspirillum galbum]NEX60249.1 prepilin-type N-terminal cleavage/methylation domain-containing protein [Noviherbaspirillum galbum]
MTLRFHDKEIEPANPIKPAASRHDGFSLVELAIVLLVVSILAALAAASYRDALRKSRRTEGRAALLRILQQQEQFFIQRQRYVLFSVDSTDEEGRGFKWYSGATPADSAYELSAEACQSEDLRQCVRLLARPGTERVGKRFSDPACGTLKLESNGTREADGNDCW